jgi:hypothetical protein
MFVFQNCREPSWERVDITVENPLEAAFVMERTRHGPGVIPSTMHQWRDVRVFGNGVLERGFWHRRGDFDENNEHARFDSVSVYGYTDCGWLIEGTQSKEHLFTHCRANGDTTGRVGVRSFGSFQWIGGAMSGHAESCFALGPPCDVVRIEGAGCETSARLLTAKGPTGNAYPVLLEQVRFMTDRLHPDGVMIDFGAPGPLTIRGGQFGNGTSRSQRFGCGPWPIWRSSAKGPRSTRGAPTNTPNTSSTFRRIPGATCASSPTSSPTRTEWRAVDKRRWTPFCSHVPFVSQWSSSGMVPVRKIEARNHPLL